MTATGSERCTATPWRGSGRGFGTSSGRSGVSTKRTENSTSSFSRGLTTSRRSPTSSCGYCSDAREPPNWLYEPRQLSALDKVEGHGPGHDQREGAEVPGPIGQAVVRPQNRTRCIMNLEFRKETHPHDEATPIHA